MLAAGAVLWFLRAAVSNERIAARERLESAHQGFAEAGKAALEASWGELAEQLSPAEVSITQQFVRAVSAEGAVGAVVLDRRGRPVYPQLSPAIEAPKTNRRWSVAAAIEATDPDAAAGEYRAISIDSSALGLTGEVELARRSELRCLLKAGKANAALEFFREYFDQPSGVMLGAGIALYEATGSEELASQLAGIANDYDLAALGSPERRFAMSALPGEFPLRAAESCSAELLLAERGAAPRTDLSPTKIEGVSAWWDGEASCRVLFDRDGLQQRIASAFATVGLPKGVRLLANPVGESAGSEVLLGTPAGASMPGWRIDVALAPEALAGIGGRKIAAYTAGGIAVIAALGGLAVAVALGLRRQMRRAQIKHDLAATISHELKTPLSSMRLLVDLLLEGDGENKEKTREYLSLIAAENARLSHLVENFLAYARIEKGAEPAPREDAAPGEIIHAAAAAVERRYGEGRLEVDVETGLPPIATDAGALGTALVNLADNACKYSPDDAPVNLSCTHRKGGDVCFEVADRGEGFTDAELARAFGIFERLDESAAAPGGCGLGLYIVKHLVERLGGRLEVDSQPGGGSQFRILLNATT